MRGCAVVEEQEAEEEDGGEGVGEEYTEEDRGVGLGAGLGLSGEEGAKVLSIPRACTSEEGCAKR